MTQEDKELLLKDLCARLPYGVKCIVTHSRTESGQKGDCGKLGTICREGIDCLANEGNFFSEFGDFKPYLFPLSSMTEEQIKELKDLISQETNFLIEQLKNDDCGIDCGKYHFHSTLELDWLNKNHFDYRGLIPKGLAIDATGLNIYKNND